MSSETDRAVTTGRNSQRLPPLIPAVVDRANRPRAWFDEDLAWHIKDVGKRRAPTEASAQRHKAGVAGELATAGYLQSPINREIYEDYEGDDGYDFKADLNGRKRRVETKTVYQSDLELKVEKSKISSADYFVLATTEDPETMAELLGYTRRTGLVAHGEEYPDSSKVHLQPCYLECFEPLRISPERIRRAHKQG